MTGTNGVPDYDVARPIIAVSSPITEGLKMALAPQKPVVASTYSTKPTEGPNVVEENNPTITFIIKGKEVPDTIIYRGSGVNVISKRTYDRLGIQEWEPCPFQLQMADTSSVRHAGLIRNLEITIGSHVFRISGVVLQVSAPGAYPLLLGRPWLKTAHRKQNWQKNIISFRRGKTNVRVPTQEQTGRSKQLTPFFVSYKTRCTTKEQMEYGDVWSEARKRRLCHTIRYYCWNHSRNRGKNLSNYSSQQQRIPVTDTL